MKKTQEDVTVLQTVTHKLTFYINITILILLRRIQAYNK